MASSPPWMRGCSVLTRPSIISGKPVNCATSTTGSPAAVERRRRPARGQESRRPRLDQRLAEIDEAGLVGNRDQRPSDLDDICRHRPQAPSSSRRGAAHSTGQRGRKRDASDRRRVARTSFSLLARTQLAASRVVRSDNPVKETVYDSKPSRWLGFAAALAVPQAALAVTSTGYGTEGTVPCATRRPAQQLSTRLEQRPRVSEPRAGVRKLGARAWRGTSPLRSRFSLEIYDGFGRGGVLTALRRSLRLAAQRKGESLRCMTTEATPDGSATDRGRNRVPGRSARLRSRQSAGFDSG